MDRYDPTSVDVTVRKKKQSAQTRGLRFTIIYNVLRYGFVRMFGFLELLTITIIYFYIFEHSLDNIIVFYCTFSSTSDQ